MEYGTPQKLPNGRYFLKISSARHQVNGLILQDPMATKSVSFKVDDPSLFTKIDAEIIAKAKESKVEWFRKENLSDEIICAAYQESITDSTLDATLLTVKGEIRALAFDTQKNPMELQAVAPGTKCDVILELSGLWFLKKSFGPIWRVIQVRTRTAPKVHPTKEYLFTEEPADDEQEADDPADYLDMD
jgi:hypothetical protein